jgi:hypothetical protein
MEKELPSQTGELLEELATGGLGSGRYNGKVVSDAQPSNDIVIREYNAAFKFAITIIPVEPELRIEGACATPFLK